MRVPVRKQGKPSGFTLVEMAIVLVIIGIILAGVMKGRDIVRGSQVKQFSQQFAQKWGTVAQTYYDKTGQFLNDGTDNGGSAAVADGRMDGTIGSAAQSTLVITTLRNVGIELCSLVKSKLVGPVAHGTVAAAAVVCVDGAAANIMNPWETTVDGEYAGPSLVSMDLVNLALTQNAITNNRNTVVLYGVPVDVAVGLDTAVDGKNDGTSGSVVGVAAAYANTAAVVARTVAGAITATDWGATTAAAAPQLQDVAIILDF